MSVRFAPQIRSKSRPKVKTNKHQMRLERRREKQQLEERWNRFSDVSSIVQCEPFDCLEVVIPTRQMNPKATVNLSKLISSVSVVSDIDFVTNAISLRPVSVEHALVKECVTSPKSEVGMVPTEEIGNSRSKECISMSKQNVSKLTWLMGAIPVGLGVATAVKSGTIGWIAEKAGVVSTVGESLTANEPGPLSSIAELANINWVVALAGVFAALFAWGVLFPNNFSMAMNFAKQKLIGIPAIVVAVVSWAVEGLVAAITWVRVYLASLMANGPVKTKLLTPGVNSSPKFTQYVAQYNRGNVPAAEAKEESWMTQIVSLLVVGVIALAVFAHVKYDSFGIVAKHQSVYSPVIATDLVPSATAALPGDFASAVFATSSPSDMKQTAKPAEVVNLNLDAPIAGGSSL
jgi:hypothetical protein